MDRQINTPEVVVVTGASAGVGRATARLFGEHGARVGLLARNEDGLEGARREIAPAYVFLASQESSYVSAAVLGVTGSAPLGG